MGYYASGDTRKTIHGCENDQGYDEREASRDATFNGLIAGVSGSDIRGGIVSFCLTLYRHFRNLMQARFFYSNHLIVFRSENADIGRDRSAVLGRRRVE